MAKSFGKWLYVFIANDLCQTDTESSRACSRYTDPNPNTDAFSCGDHQTSGEEDDDYLQKGKDDQEDHSPEAHLSDGLQKEHLRGSLPEFARVLRPSNSAFSGASEL